jgi:histone deacetylase complex regulatory component SIN3
MPFWNEELKKLMEERNKTRRNADTLQTPEAMETLRKATLYFKTKLKESKKETLHQFVSNIDYKKDGNKAHTFFSKLCNKDKKKAGNKPIIYKNKTLIEDRAKAKALCKNIAKQSNNKKLGHIKVAKSMYTRDVTDTYNGLFVITELNEAVKKLKRRNGHI